MKPQLMYTAVILLGHLAFGILSGITGPSLVDFTYLIRTNNGPLAKIEQISFNLTFVIVGSICGSFISFLYKAPRFAPNLNRQLLTALLVLLFGISSAVPPLVSTLPTYYLLGFLSGIGCGNWNTVSSTWLMELWSGRQLASALQALQLCYGLGSILGPIIVAPYLGGYLANDQISEQVIEQRRQGLAIPYAICGAVECWVGLLLLTLYFTKYRYQKSTTLDTVSKDPIKISPNSQLKLFDSTPATRRLRPLFLLLIMLLLAAYNLVEISHLTFQNTYFQSLDGPNITASEAAQIASITATSFTLGRGLSIFTASWITSASLITGHLTLGLLSILAYFACQTTLAISINSAVLGYAFSALTPAILTYVNEYIAVDDHRNAAFFIAMAIPSVFTPFLLGPYLESFPPVLLYLDLASILAAMTLFGSVALMVRCCQ